MPNFEGNWKMKSSLNFEELLKALGEFCALIVKCRNKQLRCPLNYTWITYHLFFNQVHLKKCRFWEHIWFPADTFGEFTSEVIH